MYEIHVQNKQQDSGGEICINSLLQWTLTIGMNDG